MGKGILGFCNPIVDLCAFTEDSFLEENGLRKGATEALKREKSLEIMSKMKFTSMECGGSGMNVSRLISILGYRTTVIGQRGDDENSKIVVKALKESGIEDKCIVKPEGITTSVTVCISPDAQRTMFSVCGASHEPYVEPVDLSIIAEYDAVLFEGYQISNKSAAGLVAEASAKAKELNKKSIFVISGMFSLPGYKEKILSIINNFTIITGNQEEMFILFDKNNLEDLLRYLENSHFELVAVTLGEKGSYLVHKGKSTFFPAPVVEKVVDTTGAGDAFTAGIVFGYLKGYDLSTLVKIANYVAGKAISEIGFVPKISLRSEVENLLKSN